MKSFLVSLLWTMTLYPQLAHASDCRPHGVGVTELQTLRIGDFDTLTVRGQLAEFDPCHPSVTFRKPFFSSSPRPLMIVVHGGGGLDGATQAAASAFYDLGFSTLVFDAFQMNSLNKPGSFFAVNVSNEARQRMIFKVAKGAYDWALKDPERVKRGIYIYGISNGASVAANLAAVVDPTIVKGVFAEGAPAAGIGFPNSLSVPLRMVYGRLDNYGGRAEDDLMYRRRLSCKSMNTMEGIPPGTSELCNLQTQPDGLNTSPASWIDQQKAKGADIELWWLEKSAHGVFVEFRKGSRVFDGGRTLYTYIGGTADDRTLFLEKVKLMLEANEAAMPNSTKTGS